MVLAERALTLEQFLQRQERKPALEYADGRVTQKMSPKGKHTYLQFRLVDWFIRVSAGALLAFAELRVTFGGRSLVPDVSVFLRQRAPIGADGEPIDDVFVPPDLVVEIRSPRQWTRRLIDRCDWYLANGVRVALLVDIHARSVLLFCQDRPVRRLRGRDAIDLGDLLLGLSLTADELFGMLRVA